MLTRSETNDLDNALLKQCPGPAGCACRFCKARQVIAAYERVAAVMDDPGKHVVLLGLSGDLGGEYVKLDELRHAMEG